MTIQPIESDGVWGDTRTSSKLRGIIRAGLNGPYTVFILASCDEVHIPVDGTLEIL